MNTQKIGLAVAEARDKAELSQAELAELSKVSARTIRELENGRANIGIRPLLKLLEVLRLQIVIQPQG